MKLDLSKDIDKQRATTYLGKLMDQGAKIELKKVNSNRSLSQNAYLHACFGYIAQATGYTIEEAKTKMKREFGSFMIYQVNGDKFLRSTAELDTSEMTQFIDWLRNFSSEEIGVYLMTPDEYQQNRFEVEKELQYVK